MAKTRAEVLSAIVALGLTADEAEAELRGRERAGRRILDAASREGRTEALQLARHLLHSTKLHYVTPGQPITVRPVLELEQAAKAVATRQPGPTLLVITKAGVPAPAETVVAPQGPSALRRSPARLLAEARAACLAWLRGPKWRPAVVLGGAALGLSAIGLAAGALDSPARPTVYTAETLGARVVTLIPTPPPGPPPEAHIAASPAYEVRYTLDKKRLDGGKTLYVLIDPVDISNANFKDDLKLLIKDLVAENGPSISIEIHDDPNSLRASYGRFGDKSRRDPATYEENSNIALHFVAAFSGNLNTGMYLNTLQFYAAATADTPFVGQYIEDVEFDPAP